MDNNTTDPVVLDRAQLNEATGGDADLIRELVELYLMDAEENLAALATAVAAKQLDEVHRVAHGLKGSSASMGAAEAAEAFLVLERMGREQEGAGIEAALQSANEAFERARAALTNV